MHSKATWYVKEKKNNQYFLGLEQSRNKKNCIPKVTNKQGRVVTNSKAIMAESNGFYRDLCPRRDLLQLLLFVEEKWLLCHRVCKSVNGPIFGLYSEHLSVVLRGIGFIRSQTRRNSTKWTIAEASIAITRSIFVRSRQRSTSYRLKRSSNVAFFPCGVNSS